MFSDFFSSVYEPSALGGFDPELVPPDSSNVHLSNIVLSQDSVLKALGALDVTKGSGPDGIPPFFVKHTAEVLSTPLVIIYNKCLSEGVVPRVWKAANITPVHKVVV